MLYDMKIQWCDNLLNKTAQRDESTGPEITLDPLESIRTGETKRPLRLGDTDFMQALHQVSNEHTHTHTHIYIYIHVYILFWGDG